jgi:hypothetical protein
MNMRTSLMICAGLALGGCAGQGAFPSLAPRAVETRQAPVALPPVVLVTDPAAQARVRAALAKAQAAVAGFNEALSAAQNAPGGARGSDGWIAAQMAVSRLERTREPVKIALIDLTEEQRLILFGPPSADRAMVEAAIAEVIRIDDAQTAAMAAVLARVSPR